jgi:Flp pilus assembly protein TadD
MTLHRWLLGRERESISLYPKEVTATNVDELHRRGVDLLARGEPARAALTFRAAIDAGEAAGGGMSEAKARAHFGLVRALRAAGRLEHSIGAALALTALKPDDPAAHRELSISLREAGHMPQAEAAAERARVLEWKIQLRTGEAISNVARSAGDSEP